MNKDIWHSKDFPFGTLKKVVVIHTDDITCGFGFTYAHDMHTRTKTFEQMGIIKWCYLDDLLKQSKELEQAKDDLFESLIKEQDKKIENWIKEHLVMDIQTGNIIIPELERYKRALEFAKQEIKEIIDSEFSSAPDFPMLVRINTTIDNIINGTDKNE